MSFNKKKYQVIRGAISKEVADIAYTYLQISADADIWMLQNGVTHAGGLSEPILEMLFEKKVLDQSKINIIKYSEFYPQYPWVFIEDLDESLKNKISSVFYEIKDEKILSNFKADKFSPIFDSDYDIIRQLTKELDLYDFKKRN